MEIKLKEGVTGYDAVINILEKIQPQLYGVYAPGDLIVRLGVKDYEDDGYTCFNDILYASKIGGYSSFYNDWWEGEKYINIIGFIPLDDVLHFHYMLSKNALKEITAESYTEFIHPIYALKELEDDDEYEII